MAIRRPILNQPCGVVGSLFLLIWQIGAPTQSFAQQAARGGRIVVPTARNRLAKSENDRGPLSASRVIEGMSLVFRRSAAQTADLQRLLEEQRDSRSPNYHSWLTPEQYADRFGLTSTQVATITSWLEAQGLRVGYTSRSRTWLTFSGAAGQVQNAFQTAMHRYEVNRTEHYANASDPSIPATLGSMVSMIRGLDDFRTEPPTPRVLPGPKFTASDGSYEMTPGDLGTIYDINPLYQQNITGYGQYIVVAGQSDIELSDVEQFRAMYGLPFNDPQLVLVPGSPDPGVNPADQVESSLDLEYAGGVAPDAAVLFVYSTDVWTSVAYAIDQDLAPVISTSYGYCEPLSDGVYLQTLAQQANAQGATWVSASGDSGAAGCDTGAGVDAATNGLAVFLPASVPEVTGVGGSEFNDGNGSYWSATNNANASSALSYIPELAWNDSAVTIAAGNGLASTGGGASILFPKPSWQTGPGVPADNARDVPDISFDGSNVHDPYLMYANGNSQTIGGTSVSTPVFAGILALLNQYLLSNGKIAQAGLANVNPMLYSLAQTATGAFHDITAGDNIVPCVTGSPDCPAGQLGYSAGTGYDQVTGLGSLDVYNLATSWAASLAAPTTTVASANPTTISSSGSTVLTATVSAASGTTSPTGSVSFALGQTVLGSGVLSGSGGSATASLSVSGNQLAIGDNSITATYAGSGAFLGSFASVSVNVTDASSCSYSLSSSAVSVGPAASSGTVDVTAGSGCAWTATSNVPWLTIVSGSSGTGSGTVGFSVAANTAGSVLTGTLTIAGLTFTVTQIENSSALAFYPLPPCRIADTRAAGVSGLGGAFGPPSLEAGSDRTFPVAQSGCNIPATAQAYSLNFTVSPPGPMNYLTTWPTGEPQPVVSTLNDLPGAILANAAIVPAGVNGSIDVFVSDPTDVIIDINGYFAPPGAPGALAYYPATPCRIADTRVLPDGTFSGPELSKGETRSFPVQSSSCGIPSSAQAYSLNMTVVPPSRMFYLTTWPVGQTQPYVSTLNDLAGNIVANAALVPAGTDGAVNVFVSDATNLVIDINGYFAPPGTGGLNFYPLTPCRVADTRSAPVGTFAAPALSAGETRSFPIPNSNCNVPVTAQAFSINLTVVPPGPVNFLTTWPDGQTKPLASTLNDSSGVIVANAAIVPASPTGTIDVYTTDPTSLIIDINGYFAP